MVKSKNSCIEITNNDDLCCARAHRHKDESPLHLSEYNIIRQGRDVQKTKARDLHRLAKVPEGPCGLPEIREFEKVLPDYQIIVVSADHGNAIVHCGQTALHQLILLAHRTVPPLSSTFFWPSAPRTAHHLFSQRREGSPADLRQRVPNYGVAGIADAPSRTTRPFSATSAAINRATIVGSR